MIIELTWGVIIEGAYYGVDSIEIGDYTPQFPIGEDTIERELTDLMRIEGFREVEDPATIAQDMNDAIAWEVNLDESWPLGIAGEVLYVFKFRQ